MGSRGFKKYTSPLSPFRSSCRVALGSIRGSKGNFFNKSLITGRGAVLFIRANRFFFSIDRFVAVALKFEFCWISNKSNRGGFAPPYYGLSTKWSFIVVLNIDFPLTLVYISLSVKKTLAVNSSSLSIPTHLSIIRRGSGLRIEAKSSSENFFFLTIWKASSSLGLSPN